MGENLGKPVPDDVLEKVDDPQREDAAEADDDAGEQGPGHDEEDEAGEGEPAHRFVGRVDDPLSVVVRGILGAVGRLCGMLRRVPVLLCVGMCHDGTSRSEHSGA